MMKHAKQSGLLDKAERLYFVGDNYTINLIPQALLLLGWLALVGLIVSNLGQEYVQSSHDSYSYYEPPPSTYHSPAISASYQPPQPYQAPAYSAPSSSYSSPSSSYSPGYSLPSSSAYISPSDHHTTHTSSYILPSLTSYTLTDTDVPELDTLSYGDTLSPEYKVDPISDLLLGFTEQERRDLYPVIQSRLRELQREIRQLQEANVIISQGELSNEGLRYSY